MMPPCSRLDRRTGFVTELGFFDQHPAAGCRDHLSRIVDDVAYRVPEALNTTPPLWSAMMVPKLLTVSPEKVTFAWQPVRLDLAADLDRHRRQNERDDRIGDVRVGLNHPENVGRARDR